MSGEDRLTERGAEGGPREGDNGRDESDRARKEIWQQSEGAKRAREPTCVRATERVEGGGGGK